MSVITFWSEIERETGQTATAIALATEMAIDHNSRILLLSTYYNNDDIKSAFWNYDKERKGLASILGGMKKITLESGIAGLAKVAASNKMTPELITNYTKIVFKNRLEVLEEYKENNDTEYEAIKHIYVDLVRQATQFYDYVIVDLEKGHNDLTDEILGLSDILVYSINQKFGAVNSYIESIKNGFLADKKEKIIPFIGRYDRYSKYNAKNLGRYMGQKKEINSIVYNTLFSEAADEGSMADLFLKIKTVSSTDKNAVFMSQIRALSDDIIYRIQEIQMRKMQL